MSRSTTIAAPPERIHPLLDDFHAWQEWSPWEKIDPDLQRTFTGARAVTSAASKGREPSVVQGRDLHE
ncbi:MAG: hypothetical protein WKF50_04440 [Nocardioides sp.]